MVFRNLVILQLKNEDEIFPGFKRGSLPEKSISGLSPALDVSKNVFDFVIRTPRRPKIATKDTLLQLFLKMSKTRYTGVAHKVVVFFSGASFLIIE